jgi:hypothetical protein
MQSWNDSEGGELKGITAEGRTEAVPITDYKDRLTVPTPAAF